MRQSRRKRARATTNIAHAAGPENGGFSRGGKAPMPALLLVGSRSTPAFKTLNGLGRCCSETLTQKNLQCFGRFPANNILAAKFQSPAGDHRITIKWLEQSAARTGAAHFQLTGIIFNMNVNTTKKATNETRDIRL